MGIRVGSFLPFMPRGIFEDADIKAPGDAFDGACETLYDTGQPDVVHEVMARPIIAVARKGERGCGVLRQAALAAQTVIAR